ncbi:MAG: L-threonylcarbamoyladenylate synthase [Hyphomicrobiaceae bacterium]|nr:L-threonylcarbamoyladenylate synthase [Hyphomicrobiaceae bacterium]
MRLAQPSRETIADAARLLLAGELVAFPTETVYGLGADATNGRAVARIYAAKGRPRFNPLIAHVASAAEAGIIGELGPLARRLADVFWPGPLTLVLAKTPACPIADLVTAGLDTVAVRVPSHPVALALIAAVGRPVAAPSANRSGHVSATTAAHVDADLGAGVAMILDAGPTMHGLESTIVDATGDVAVLLRPGAVTSEAIADVLGQMPVTAPPRAAAAQPTAPGQLESHYAPGLPVRLDASSPREGEAFLAFGPYAPAYDGPLMNLSRSGDLVEAAANLFSALRRLDQSGAKCLAVMPIPTHGLGSAINDRLRRAAAPRPGVDASAMPEANGEVNA